MKISRRQFLKGAAVTGVGLALPLKFGVRDAHAFYQSPGLQKFVPQTFRGVTGSTGIPVAASDGTVLETGATHFIINIQPFTDQLHPSFAPNSTKLWGFFPETVLVGSTTPRHLGGIIIAQKGVPTQITFRNKLNVSKHIIPLDTTIPGANQGVNRTAIHLHGGLVPWISDGGPFDWWAPNGTHGLSFQNKAIPGSGAALNEAEYFYPNDQSARFVWYHDHAFGITRINAYAGIASAYLIRDSFEKGLQNLGLPPFIEESITHIPLPLPIQELPIVIQDKIFVGSDINALDPTWGQKGLPTATGSLWYPHVYEKNRWRLLGAGRNLPNPSSIPEMFGDTMLANGTVYPDVDVEPRRYRLRILNACSSRFLNLQLYVQDASADGITLNPITFNPTNAGGPDFLVLGNEAGFLKNPVSIQSYIPFTQPTADPFGYGGSLITGPAERWDVLVDFSGNAPDGLPYAGKKVILYTDAPAPFPGGDPRNDYFPGAPGNPIQPNPGFGPNTRQIMRFNVGSSVSDPQDLPLTITTATDLTPGIDPFLVDIGPNGTYTLRPGVTLSPNSPRRLTLNETFDAYGRLTQMLGTDSAEVPSSPTKFGRPYIHFATEKVNNGDIEIWEILNLTADTHPMHFHLVNVQVLNREAFDAANYTGGAPAPIAGTLRSPDPTELGWKETVKMSPGEVTRIIMEFKLPPVPFTVPFSPRFTDGKSNEFVWHCHILDHEEHDMMRPVVVYGDNPTFGVNPSFHTVIGSVGGTVNFFVFGGTPPYNITYPFGAPAPSPNPLPAKGTFSVTVPPGAASATYIYTITDSTPSTPNTTTADVIVAPL